MKKLPTILLFSLAYQAASVYAVEKTYSDATITDGVVTSNATYTFAASELGDNDYETRLLLLTNDGGSFESSASVTVKPATGVSSDWVKSRQGGFGIKQSSNSTVLLKSGASLSYDLNWQINPTRGFTQGTNSTLTIDSGASMDLKNMGAAFNGYYYRNKQDRKILSVDGTINVKGTLNWVYSCGWQKDTDILVGYCFDRRYEHLCRIDSQA